MSNQSPNAAEWFEIPTADLPKAIDFYNAVFSLQLEAADFGPNRLAIFPHTDPAPGGCLMQGPGMTPSGTGSVVYLSTPDIDAALARIEPNGGKIVIPKTPIGADRGYFARFHDPEGNLVGICGLG